MLSSAAANIMLYCLLLQSLVSRHLASWQQSGQEGVKAYGALKMLTFDFILQVSAQHN
jgi:hypothetical protein